MMITVGDDNRVLLFSISYSGNYELIQTMAGNKEKKRKSKELLTMID
jgi:hypothetical protein